MIDPMRRRQLHPDRLSIRIVFFVTMANTVEVVHRVRGVDLVVLLVGVSSSAVESLNGKDVDASWSMCLLMAIGCCPGVRGVEGAILKKPMPEHKGVENRTDDVIGRCRTICPAFQPLRKDHTLTATFSGLLGAARSHR
jgi:hypothetical protein